MASMTSRIRHAWNAFNSRNLDDYGSSVSPGEVVVSYGSSRPDRLRVSITNERSIVSSVYTRISIDSASVPILHVRVDDDDRFLEVMDSGLTYCLTEEPNLDQGPTMFIQDAVMTLMDKGVMAIVPVETSLNPNSTGGFDIRNLRVGEIVSWEPERVKVRLYNERTGKYEEILLAKKYVAIVENPLYMVMNEPNSTLQRLITKLNMLDDVDKQSSSGKLDLIVQLPYTIKSEAKRQQAQQRREDIEFQLRDSQYGIAYTDATEKITQLNRPAENNLLKQVEYLTQMLYAQLGLTEAVMNGTADEKAMLNYRNRTVKPILKALTESMNRSFLTKTARSQNQRVRFFSNPFELVPIDAIADIADKFTRNEILTSNEIRQIIGIRPSKDPKADELRNSNMPEAKDSGLPVESGSDQVSSTEKQTANQAVDTTKEGDSQNGSS